MGETNHQQSTTSSRLGIRNGSGATATPGEIVEVQGGHIVRSTGRKDRHSKVCTAKGPRDRRVRLSAHTAIQFYDVQDRLGYDRPSKAVDWLIKKAKAAIDELDQLPAWNPLASNASTSINSAAGVQPQGNEENENAVVVLHRGSSAVDSTASASRGNTGTIVGGDCGGDGHGRHNLQHQMVEHPTNSSAFLPQSLDSDAIADTIKSFFPVAASAEEPPPSSMHFHHSYPPDLLSRTSSHIQNQDLQLSLQSLQDPILLHQHQAHGHAHQHEQTLFSGTASPLSFGVSTASWPEHHQHQQHQAEIGRFQRILAWNAGGDSGNGGNGGSGGGGESNGFIFNSLPMPTPPLQPFFGRNQFFSQRGPLQSSNTPSVRAWIDPSNADNEISHAIHQHQSSFSGMGFVSGGFSGFHIPARIQGEEEHGGISDKPSSASSDSRH